MESEDSCVSPSLGMDVTEVAEWGLPGFAEHESIVSFKVVWIQLYFYCFLNHAVHIAIYPGQSMNFAEFYAVPSVYNMFR